MFPLAVLPEAVIWSAAAAGVACMLLAGLIVIHPNLVAKGQDPAGRGMAVGCTCILLWSLCTLLGMLTAGAAFFSGPHYHVATRIAGYVPLAISAGLVFFTWLTEVLRRSRSRRADYERRMAVPEYLVITDKSEEVSPLYNALRSLDETTETNVYEHPLALRHQFRDHLPRARLIALKAWTQPRPGETDLANTALLLARDLAEEKPCCPILLFGTDPAALDELEKILCPAWQVTRLLITDDPNWIRTQWLPAVKPFLLNQPQPAAA